MNPFYVLKKILHEFKIINDYQCFPFWKQISQWANYSIGWIRSYHTYNHGDQELTTILYYMSGIGLGSEITIGHTGHVTFLLK